MTEDNIKRYLLKQYEQLALSIKNRKIREIVFEQSYIAGGAIASLVLNEIPNDLDIYFYDKEQCKKVIVYFRKYHNDRCLKFSDNALLVYPNIHFIFKFYGKPQNTIRRFDFYIVEHFMNRTQTSYLLLNTQCTISEIRN